MIFVTVGNATQGFRRLLDSVERLAGRGFFKDEIVVIQTGNNVDFQSAFCKQEDFLSPERFQELVQRSEVIICHAGAGTLYHAFRAGKVPVVMPRRKKYGEHVEDQLELVKALASEGRIVPAYEPEDLTDAIAEARRRDAQACHPPPARMLDLVDKAICELIVLKGHLR